MKVYSPLKAPKKHQTESVKSMLKKPLANFDDQGLGKCKQAYDLAGKLFERKEIDLVLVISKASLRENFLKEISEDANQVIARIVSGNRTERASTYLYPTCHVLIVSYDTAVADCELLCDLLRKNRVLVCLDEAHYIKNPTSRRARACITISQCAERKVVFTGTPAPNDPVDLFTQFRFMGFDVGETKSEFKDKFPTLQALRSFLLPLVVRRRKESLPELNLPQKKIVRVTVNLSAEERRIYNQLRDQLMLEVRNRFGHTKRVHVDHALTRLTRLLQLTSNPTLIEAGSDACPSKFIVLDKLVGEVQRKKRKVIIWTSFQENVRQLCDRYSHLGAIPLFGLLDKAALMANAKAFQEDPSVQVLVAIPACAREGFTLTAASEAIYLDRSFSFLDWAQSQDRIHRISQKKNCTIYILEAANTIDEKIDEILERKRHTQDYLLGDVDHYQGLDYVSCEDISRILGGTLA